MVTWPEKYFLKIMNLSEFSLNVCLILKSWLESVALRGQPLEEKDNSKLKTMTNSIGSEVFILQNLQRRCVDQDSWYWGQI